MRMEKAGGAYVALAVTSNPFTGAAQTADVLPVATASRNGVDDLGFSLSVNPLGQGRYLVAGTVPAWAAADDVHVTLAATVEGIAGAGVIDRFRIVPAPVFDALAAGDHELRIDVRAVGGEAVGSIADVKFSPALEIAEDNAEGTTWSYEALWRLVFAFLLGERSGGGAATKVFKVPGGTTPRVVISTDVNGNSTELHTLDAGDLS